jgi:hypothetical protein
VDDAPAGSLGVPGARLLLATSAGKLTHRFKVRRGQTPGSRLAGCTSLH